MPPSIRTTVADAKEQIEFEKAERVRQHQAMVVGKKRMAIAMTSGAPSTLNLFAQGDSWFDYPLPVPLIDQSDIIAHLKRLPAMAPEILSMAHYGEAAEDMLGVQKLHEMIAQLSDPSNGTFDAILFSGGGNDLAGNQFRLWLNDATSATSAPANGLNATRVADILGVVEAGYEDLIAMRDKVVPGTPIFVHNIRFRDTYRNGVACAGPWLRPGLDDRGWNNPLIAQSIVKELLLQFDALISRLASNPLRNFVHVRTQGTLSSSQWANELHPNPNGFAAIAGIFVDALRSRFPGRI